MKQSASENRQFSSDWSLLRQLDSSINKDKKIEIKKETTNKLGANLYVKSEQLPTSKPNSESMFLPAISKSTDVKPKQEIVKEIVKPIKFELKEEKEIKDSFPSSVTRPVKEIVKPIKLESKEEKEIKDSFPSLRNSSFFNDFRDLVHPPDFPPEDIFDNEGIGNKLNIDLQFMPSPTVHHKLDASLKPQPPPSLAPPPPPMTPPSRVSQVDQTDSSSKLSKLAQGGPSQLIPSTTQTSSIMDIGKISTATTNGSSFNFQVPITPVSVPKPARKKEKVSPHSLVKVRHHHNSLHESVHLQQRETSSSDRQQQHNVMLEKEKSLNVKDSREIKPTSVLASTLSLPISSSLATTVTSVVASVSMPLEKSLSEQKNKFISLSKLNSQESVIGGTQTVRVNLDRMKNLDSTSMPPPPLPLKKHKHDYLSSHSKHKEKKNKNKKKHSKDKEKHKKNKKHKKHKEKDKERNKEDLSRPLKVKLVWDKGVYTPEAGSAVSKLSEQPPIADTTPTTISIPSHSTIDTPGRIKLKISKRSLHLQTEDTPPSSTVATTPASGALTPKLKSHSSRKRDRSSPPDPQPSKFARPQEVGIKTPAAFFSTPPPSAPPIIYRRPPPPPYYSTFSGPPQIPVASQAPFYSIPPPPRFPVPPPGYVTFNNRQRNPPLPAEPPPVKPPTPPPE